MYLLDRNDSDLNSPVFYRACLMILEDSGKVIFLWKKLFRRYDQDVEIIGLSRSSRIMRLRG